MVHPWAQCWFLRRRGGCNPTQALAFDSSSFGLYTRSHPTHGLSPSGLLAASGKIKGLVEKVQNRRFGALCLTPMFAEEQLPTCPKVQGSVARSPKRERASHARKELLGLQAARGPGPVASRQQPALRVCAAAQRTGAARAARIEQAGRWLFV